MPCHQIQSQRSGTQGGGFLARWQDLQSFLTGKALLSGFTRQINDRSAIVGLNCVGNETLGPEALKPSNPTP